jgi:hypothetical protein
VVEIVGLLFAVLAYGVIIVAAIVGSPVLSAIGVGLMVSSGIGFVLGDRHNKIEVNHEQVIGEEDITHLAFNHMLAGGSVLYVVYHRLRPLQIKGRGLRVKKEPGGMVYLLPRKARVSIFASGEFVGKFTPNPMSRSVLTYGSSLDEDGFVLVKGKKRRPEYHDEDTGVIVFRDVGMTIVTHV